MSLLLCRPNYCSSPEELSVLEKSNVSCPSATFFFLFLLLSFVPYKGYIFRGSSFSRGIGISCIRCACISHSCQLSAMLSSSCQGVKRGPNCAATSGENCQSSWQNASN